MTINAIIEFIQVSFSSLCENYSLIGETAELIKETFHAHPIFAQVFMALFVYESLKDISKLLHNALDWMLEKLSSKKNVPTLNPFQVKPIKTVPNIILTQKDVAAENMGTKDPATN